MPLLTIYFALQVFQRSSSLIIPLERRQPTASVSPFFPLSQDKSSSSETIPTHLQAFVPGLPAYFARLSFGNDAQAIDVLVDTGSFDLLIPSDLCTACSHVSQRLNVASAGVDFVHCGDAMRCHGQCMPDVLNLFGSTSQTIPPQLYCGPHGGICEAGSNLCLFDDKYADGSYASGVVVTAPSVNFSGVTLKDVTFGAIASASDTFFEAPQGGGIMGMAYRGSAVSTRANARGNLDQPVTKKDVVGCDGETPCMVPLLDALIAQQEQGVGGQGQVRDIFAICGHPTSPVMLLGESSLGKESQEYYEGELQYARMEAPYGLYMVGVAGLGVVEASGVDVPKGVAEAGSTFMLHQGNAGLAIIDTGATGLYFPRSAYLKLKTYLQRHYCHVPFICGPLPTPTPELSDSEAAAVKGKQQERDNSHRALRSRRHHRHHQQPSQEEAQDEDEPPPSTIFESNIWAKYDEATVARLPTLTIRLEDGGVELRLSPQQYLIRNVMLSGVTGMDGQGKTNIAYYQFGIRTFGEGVAGESQRRRMVSGQASRKSERGPEAFQREKYEGMLPGTSITRDGTHRGSVRPNKNNGSPRELYILGELLLNQMFVVFDRDKRRVGFAPAAARDPSLKPSSPEFVVVPPGNGTANTNV